MANLNPKALCATALLTLICIMANSCKEGRSSSVYEIPEGFTGWVLIQYGQTNYPVLPVKNGKRIFCLGRDGQLLTSSGFEAGWATDEYYYQPSNKRLPVTDPGEGGQIWGASVGFSQTQGKKGVAYENFFIGTEAQFKSASERPKP